MRACLRTRFSPKWPRYEFPARWMQSGNTPGMMRWKKDKEKLWPEKEKVVVAEQIAIKVPT